MEMFAFPSFFGWYSLCRFLNGDTIDKLRETHSYLSYWTCRLTTREALSKKNWMFVYFHHSKVVMVHRWNLVLDFVTRMFCCSFHFRQSFFKPIKMTTKKQFKTNAHTCVHENQLMGTIDTMWWITPINYF